MEKGTNFDTNLTRARLGIEACRRNSSKRAQSSRQLAETTAVYEKETEKNMLAVSNLRPNFRKASPECTHVSRI
jgi:hypothetical protein